MINEIKLINSKNLIQAKLEEVNFDGEGGDIFLCKFKDEVFYGHSEGSKNVFRI
jgi:hypothetical protein